MKRTIFTIFIIGLLASKCENPIAERRYSIKFTNNSNINICPYFEKPYSKYLYPDTISIAKNKPYLIEIKKGNYFYYDFGAKYEQVYEYVESDTLSFYVFNSDTLVNYPWDIIRSNYMILQRYDLSLNDLQNRNFEIEYPYDSTRGKLKVYTK
jgi:hypothetical protein